jgi:hypothetical protein
MRISSSFQEEFIYMDNITLDVSLGQEKPADE